MQKGRMSVILSLAVVFSLGALQREAHATCGNKAISASPASQTGIPGQTLSYKITIKNADTAECGASDFSVGLAQYSPLFAGWASTLSSPVTLNLAPGAMATLTATVTSPAAAVSGVNYQVVYSIINKRSGAVSANYACPYQLIIPSDTKAPSTPMLSASRIGMTQVDLVWMPSTDNVGVDSYFIYTKSGCRDNFAILPYGVVSGSVTSYSVQGLTADTAYCMQVQARDRAGNLSKVSSLKLRTLK